MNNWINFCNIIFIFSTLKKGKKGSFMLEFVIVTIFILFHKFAYYLFAFLFRIKSKSRTNKSHIWTFFYQCKVIYIIGIFLLYGYLRWYKIKLFMKNDEKVFSFVIVSLCIVWSFKGKEIFRSVPLKAGLLLFVWNCIFIKGKKFKDFLLMRRFFDSRK